MEDVKIGRAIRAGQRTVSVGTSSTPFVPASPRRIALVISPPTSGTLTLSFGQSASATVGIVIPSSSGPVILDQRILGDIVSGPINASASVAQNVTYWESYFEADVAPR